MPLKIGIGLNTGPMRGQKYGVGLPLQLLGARRHRQRRLKHEGLLRSYRHRRADRIASKADVRDAGDRSHSGDAQRIEAFRHDPPPPDWNGVYESK